MNCLLEIQCFGQGILKTVVGITEVLRAFVYVYRYKEMGFIVTDSKRIKKIQEIEKQ